MKKNKRGTTDSLLLVLVVLVVLICVPAGCYVLPKYGVYKATLAGEAELKQAESNRRISVLEAEAKRDSAALYAQAEIERAKGVAESNKIIGMSLKENEAYLRWLWISSLSETQNSIVYIPTEAGLPILEAGKR